MNTHQDMTAVITPKSDQINADDLIGGPRTITIRDVQIKGGQEQPVSIYFDGSDKAFRPCKSMCRVLVAVWGPDAKAYIGRSITLYRDPAVKWGGMEVGGIRISHMTDMTCGPMTMALTATKGSRKPFIVKPLAKPSNLIGEGRERLVEASKLGMAALEAAWKALTREQKVALQSEMPDLKAAASTVEQPAEQQPPTTTQGADDGNPFSS